MSKSLSQRRAKRARRMQNRADAEARRASRHLQAYFCVASSRVVDVGEAERLIHISSMKKQHGYGWLRGADSPEKTALLALFAAVDSGRGKVHSLRFEWEPRGDGSWLRSTVYKASFIPQLLPVGWTQVGRWHDSKCRLWILREAVLMRLISCERDATGA